VRFSRLVVGDVHEAPRDADGKRDHVVGLEVDVLHRLALVPFAAPAAGQGDESFVRVVVVHQRTLAGFCPTVAEVEAFRD
jgi:hypothetical protein